MSERIKVWRAWDHQWVADCDEHGEVHWGGRWIDAMVVAWGHLAMHHERPALRLVIPERGGMVEHGDTRKWLLTTGPAQ